ncbi:hypothetical protein HPB47_004447, partial [Ixodes persulcatus]
THSRSPCPGLRIAFPTPALRRLAVPGYQCPSLAAEPPRECRGPDQMARARRFHRSCFRPRWWTTPGFAMGQARQPGSDVPAQLQPRVARTVSRQLVSPPPTACHRVVELTSVDAYNVVKMSRLSGDKWREIKALTSPAFKSSMMRRAFPIIDECADEFLKIMEKTERERGAVEISLPFCRLSMDILFRFLGNINYDNLSNLQYLNQVISESLRLVNRRCQKNSEFNGLRIPKGTHIEVPVRLMHHDPRYWVHPEKFDPDRLVNRRCQKNSEFNGLRIPKGTHIEVPVRLMHHDPRYWVHPEKFDPDSFSPLFWGKAAAAYSREPEPPHRISETDHPLPRKDRRFEGRSTCVVSVDRLPPSSPVNCMLLQF